MNSLLKRIAIGSAIVGFAAISLPALAGVVADKTTETDCTNASYYWYKDTCYETQVEALTAQINDLTATLQALQSQLGTLQGTTPTTPTASTYTGVPADFTFTKNLYKGMKDQDVVYLKKVLDVEVPDHASWSGSNYFGSKTKAAVVAFQNKYKDEISAAAGYTIKGTGFVGKGTRTELNALLSAAPAPECTTDADCATGYECKANKCEKKQVPAVITSVSPTDGATDVAVDTNITATFSVDLDAATVNTTNVKVTAGTTEVAGTVSYNTSTKVVTFDPTDNLAYSTAYTVTLSKDIKKSDGTDALTADYSSTFTTVAAPAATGLTVELADDTPSAAVIPGGSLYNSILKLNFSAGGEDVTVTGITVTKGGYVSNTSVTGISVWDEEGDRLGNIVTALTADGEATVDFGDNDLVVSAAQTRSLIIKANISSSANAGTISFKVASASDIATDGDVTINGTFPIVSNTMSITSGSTLGDVRIDPQSAGGYSSSTYSSASGNVKVGDTDVTIAKFRFTQNDSDEAIQIEKIVLYIEGTINEDKDLTNFRLYAPDGTLLASADKPVDRYVTLSLDNPYKVDKGLSKDLTVKVDIADGSTHWFRAQIQNDYDLMIKGVNSGAYLVPEDSSGETWTPGTDGADDNSYFKIQQGDLTVSKAASSPSGNVSPGDTDVVLAKFNLKASGEKLEIRQMKIAIENAGPTDLTGSVKVKDADTGTTYLSVAASDSDLQVSSVSSIGDLDTQNLSTYIVIESGKTKTVEVTGSISSNATSGNTYTVYVGKFYTKRYSSNDYTYLPDSTSYYYANGLQVGSVSLSVHPNAAFTGQRVAKGSTAAEVGEFVLGASSADDVRISSIQIKYSTTTGIQNVYLAKEDGTKLGDTIGTPNYSSGNSVTVDWTISKSTSEILKVFADVTTDASSTDFYVYIPANDITAYGVSSGKDASGPDSTATSSSVAINTPTLTISRDADAPISQIVLANQNGVELDKIKFEASYEDLTLGAITLQLTSASSTWATTSAIASNIEKVYLYDGDTLLNDGGTPVSNGLVGITGLNVTLPADTEKVLTVKADISDANALTPTSVGGIQVYATDTTYLAVYKSTGIMDSGITLTSNAASNYFLFTLAAPEITSDASDNISASQTPDPDDIVARFTITNNGARTLTFATATVYASLTGYNSNDTGSISNFRLYDESGTSLASASVTLSTSTPTSTISFGGFTVTQEIAPGASKTYIVKADTSSVRGGLESTDHVYLTLQLKGNKGYSSSDSVSDPSGEELYWADGVINYSYTNPAGTSYSNLLATDNTNITISGTALVY